MVTIRIPVAKDNPAIERITITCVRVLIGVVLLTAGMAKVANFSTFVTQVALYDLVPMSIVRLISYLILSAELSIGLALILGYFSRGTSILSAGLFSIFIWALSQALWQGLPLDDCGCENVFFNLFDWSVDFSWKIVFVDAILLAGCLLVAISNSTGYGMDAFLRKDVLSGDKHEIGSNP